MHVIQRTVSVSKTWNKSGITPDPIILRKGEHGDTQLMITVLGDDNTSYPLAGKTVRFCAKYDQDRWIRALMTVTEGMATYILDEAFASVSGHAAASYLEISDGKSVLPTDTIPVYILDNADASGEELSKYKNTVDALISELEDYKRTMAEAVSSANEAATKANEAAESVSGVVESVSEAVESANSAASEATTQAEAAQSAASEAASAAQTANAAATGADDAASTATGAAQAANQAVSDLQAKVEAGDFNGATFTPSMTSDGDLSWDNDKELPNPETVNLKGPQGDGLTILDSYDSLEALQAAHPDNNEVGDGYMAADHYYVWNGSEWADCGTLKGAPGDPGEPGEPGPPGDEGPSGKDLFIHVEVDSDGNVWATYPDDVNAPELELADGCLWVICDGERVNLGTVRGTKIFTGEGAPGSITGQIKDDLYIDTQDKGLYKLADTWELLTSLAGGGSSSMNLLDNWYFREPINQRGLSVYDQAKNGSYTVDRWYFGSNGSQLAVASGRVKLTHDTDGVQADDWLLQRLPTEIDPNGMTLNFSVLFDDGQLLACSGKVDTSRLNTTHFSIAGQYKGHRCVIQFRTYGASDRNIVGILIAQTAEERIELGIIAAKLEVGDHQTLAKQVDGTWQLLDAPPNPQQELAKCMRYQQVLNSSSLCYGLKTTNTNIRMSIPLSVPMRAKPTIIDNSDHGMGIRGIDGPISGTKIASCALSNWSNQLIAVNFTLQSEAPTPTNETPVVGYLNSPIILDANL